MTEPSLGSMFRSPVPPTSLDAEAVIRASRRRRRPRLVAAAVAAAAVCTVVVVGVLGGIGTGALHLGGTVGAATSAAGSAARSPESQPHDAVPQPAAGDVRPPGSAGINSACQLNSAIPGDTVVCGCGAMNAAPIAPHLAAVLSFPAERVGHSSDGVLTLTNTGRAAIGAVAATPQSFFLAGSIIESPVGANDSAAHRVQLASGASMTLAVALPLFDCAGSVAPAGAYRVGALVELTLSNGEQVDVIAPSVNVTIAQ